MAFAVGGVGGLHDPDQVLDNGHLNVIDRVILAELSCCGWCVDVFSDFRVFVLLSLLVDVDGFQNKVAFVAQINTEECFHHLELLLMPPIAWLCATHQGR